MIRAKHTSKVWPSRPNTPTATAGFPAGRLTFATNISALCLAIVSVQCTSESFDQPVTTTRAALSSVDAVLCDARSATIIANTGNVIVNSGAVVDSYESSLGNYGGSNVGDEASIQAATSVLNNGGAIDGTVIENAPAGFPSLTPPTGATNLPLGSSNPGSLNINGAADSIVLESGDYIVANLNLNGSGAIEVAPGGEVRIWVTGSLNLGGEVNPMGTPDRLTLVLPNPGWVNLNGGAFHGLLYAPTSNVNLGGSVFGSVLGKSVTLNSGGAVHFDLDSTCEASPQAELDQSFTTPNALAAGLYGTGAWMAQTYTAGITGNLQGVSISVTAFNPNYTARIQVRTVENGEPSNIVLGETLASSGGNLDINTVIEFSTPVPQVAGETYALLVDYPDAPPFVDNAPSIADWAGSSVDAYPGGYLIATLDGGTTWDSFGMEFDLLFQTFVVPE